MTQKVLYTNTSGGLYEALLSPDWSDSNLQKLGIGASTHLAVYRIGGGLIEYFRKEDLSEIPAIPIHYQVDIAYLENGPKYPCVSEPRIRWNGWAVPWFKRDTIDKLLSDYGRRIYKEELLNGIHHIFTTNELTDPDDDDSDHFYSKEIDGETLYTGDGFCWNLISDDHTLLNGEKVQEMRSHRMSDEEENETNCNNPLSKHMDDIFEVEGNGAKLFYFPNELINLLDVRL